MHELDSRVIKNGNGGHERQSWVSGEREDLGQVVDGWTGKETFIRTPVIKAVVVFDVIDRKQEMDGYDWQARQGDVPPRTK